MNEKTQIKDLRDRIGGIFVDQLLLVKDGVLLADDA
jgi:hypothetical protein